MWDRLLVDCNIATLQPAPGNPLGIVENGAIGIADGKVVRVGRRTELAGYRAARVDALGGAWVTPGLIDCHTHLIFGGTRADEHAMRRRVSRSSAGASSHAPGVTDPAASGAPSSATAARLPAGPIRSERFGQPPTL